MQEQSQRSIQFVEPQLTLVQLIELAQYTKMAKNSSKFRLLISDFDLNFRQLSEFYVQKRRGLINPSPSETSLNSSQKAEQVKSTKKSKVENVKISNLLTLQQSSLTSKVFQTQSKAERLNETLNLKAETEKKLTTASKMKVETAPIKKIVQEYSDKQSSYKLKQFEKPHIEQFSNEFNTPSHNKVYLSEYIKNTNTKSDKKSEKDANSSKIAKTEKSSPIRQKEKSNKQISHSKKSVQQSPVIEYQIKIGDSKVGDLPQNFRNSSISKSKSKSKIKKPKETSFIKKSPLKVTIKQAFNDLIYFQASKQTPNHESTLPKTQLEKKETPYSRPETRIKAKCQDITPIQDFEGVPYPPQLQAEYNHKDEQQQFHKSEMNAASPIQLQTHQQYQQTCMEYFAIPLSRQIKKEFAQKQSPSLPQIPSDLKSLVQQESNDKKYRQKQKGNPKDEESNPSRQTKSSRKKIFQNNPAKAFTAQAEDKDILMTELNDEQMKLLLGGKGNKYKQAIILEFIKQNRKNSNYK